MKGCRPFQLGKPHQEDGGAFFIMKNMSEKTREKTLTKRERLFCKLKYDDEFTDEAIARQVGISPSTLYEWEKRPRIIRGIDRLGEADTKSAIRYYQKNARRAAKATVKLTETENIKDKKGNTIKQIFIQPGEVVRKASADILQALKIDVKGGESGASHVLVYLPDNKRQKDDPS